MPKRKPFKNDLSKFVQSQAEDIFMYGFIEGAQHFLPGVPAKRIIEAFKKKYNLTEEEFPLDCALTIYTVVKKRYFESLKNDKKI